MKRIRWGNVAIATVVLLMLGYAGLALFGFAPLPASLLPGGRTEASDTTLAPVPTEAAEPQMVEPTPAPTEAPQPTPVVANLAPTRIADDGGFQSEVPVPQSTGSFPLGTITVAFDKEFPPYSPVVMLYQEKLGEAR